MTASLKSLARGIIAVENVGTVDGPQVRFVGDVDREGLVVHRDKNPSRAREGLATDRTRSMESWIAARP